MPDYAIGDIQGCYDSLQRLLEHIHYDDNVDQLWFVGDLVSRGDHSLKVLRFLKNLSKPPKITLGNHDLALLKILFCSNSKEPYHESLRQVIEAEDAAELGNWLRHQPLLQYDERLNVVMCHAGIAPIWSLDEAKMYAKELELVLKSERFVWFLSNCFGNQPACWSDSLTGIERLRTITNYLTRMRFCDEKGCLFLEYKGNVLNAPKHHIPWYALPSRKKIDASIVFGHWASLKGVCPDPNVYAIDTGYIWGGQLTALRLQDKQRFVISDSP